MCVLCVFYFTLEDTLSVSGVGGGVIYFVFFSFYFSIFCFITFPSHNTGKFFQKCYVNLIVQFVK